MTWGDSHSGGASDSEQLRGVQQIYGSCGAFAAILDDGSVVSWGDADSGADSSGVQGQLRNIHSLQATSGAFAALCNDGSVGYAVQRKIFFPFLHFTADKQLAVTCHLDIYIYVYIYILPQLS